MKNKKLLLPITIIISAIIMMFVFVILSGIAKKPTVTEHEFPFSITYEYNENTEKIESVYNARFENMGGYSDTKERYYSGNIEGRTEDNSQDYVIFKSDKGELVLATNFNADYLMGDPMYDYYDDGSIYEPQLLYYDNEGIEYSDEETISSLNAKIIDWEYPEPIENSFEFSHISRFSGDRSVIVTLIGLLALLACVFFVKREDGLNPNSLDKLSKLFNIIICVGGVPFLTVVSVFTDINGGSSAITHQIYYFLPSITLLGVALSVSLRRKGFSKSGLIVQFVGPIILFLNMIAEVIGFMF